MNILNQKKKKFEKGLSLIESAMVLALAATVTAGVMFYYQSASDSNKSQSAISLVMSATSAINGLYIGQAGYTGLEPKVLVNSSAIPDTYKDTKTNTINNPFGGKLEVVPSSGNGATQFGYALTLNGLPKSACISLATLNLGTSAKGYGVGVTNPQTTGTFGNALSEKGNAKATPITPAEAANTCEDNGSVTYFMK